MGKHTNARLTRDGIVKEINKEAKKHHAKWYGHADASCSDCRQVVWDIFAENGISEKEPLGRKIWHKLSNDNKAKNQRQRDAGENSARKPKASPRDRRATQRR